MEEDFWLKLVAVLVIAITGLTVALKAVVQVLQIRKQSKEGAERPTGPVPVVLTAEKVKEIVAAQIKEHVSAIIKAHLHEHVACYNKEGSCFEKADDDVCMILEFVRSIYGRIKSVQAAVGDKSRHPDTMGGLPPGRKPS